MAERPYHLGFGTGDLDPGTTVALLSGDPGRSAHIATELLTDARPLSTHRGLDAYAARTAAGTPVVCATSGMGAPSLSIVVNELVQVGIGTVVRIGTTGSIQPRVRAGSVVIASGALCDQGAARDIAPDGYPAVADPFLTVAMAEAAAARGMDHHVGIVASVDTFYEGQERTTTSANPHLLRRLVGRVDELRDLGVLSFEMEAATLFTMAGVYGFSAGCACAVVAERAEAEAPRPELIEAAVARAVAVAVAAIDAPRSHRST